MSVCRIHISDDRLVVPLLTRGSLSTSTHTLPMENPNEKRESELMARIIKLMETLNQLLTTINQSLDEINLRNRNIEVTNQLWQHYTRSCAYDMEEEQI